MGRLLTAVTFAATVGLASLAACSMIIDAETAQCRTTADCIAKGTKFASLICGPEGLCVSEGGCHSNAECIAANGGKPFVCNKTTRTCASLAPDLVDGGPVSAACTPLYREGDLQNDEMVWIGLILDTTSPLSAEYGPLFLKFAELARSEIMTKTNGLPAVTEGGSSRPLGLLQCESNGDRDTAVKAAKYLAEDVGIQLFIAGDSPTTAVPIEQEVLLPKKAMNIGMVLGGTNDIPSGSPPLYFPVRSDVSNWKNLVPSAISALEPEVRARHHLTPTDDMKVMVIANSNDLNSSVTLSAERNITFNGRDALANAPNNYKKLIYSEKAQPAELDFVVSEVAKFKPDLVVGGGFGEIGDVILPAADRQLTSGGSVGPYWLLPSAALTKNLFQEATLRMELQTRLRWSQADVSPESAKYTALQYASAHPSDPYLDVNLKGFVMIPYDLIYLYAYAIAANGAHPVTGENIAKSIAKVFTTGAPAVTAGRGDLYTGFNAFVPPGPGAIYFRGVETFRGPESGIVLDLNLGKVLYWPFSIYCPMSNGVAGMIYKEYPDFAAVTGQPTGFSFTAPDYKGTTGTRNTACDLFLP